MSVIALANVWTVEFDPGCEAMIFDLDGTPVHGGTIHL
jgi:hypothetical protein